MITAGDFFGAGSGSWFDQVVVKPIAQGRLDYPGDPALVHAWAYLPDLARAFVAVAALPDRTTFERFAFAGHSVTGAEFLRRDRTRRGAARRGPGARLAPRQMPWPLIRVVGLFVPMWRELATMSYLWRVPHALAGTKLATRCSTLAPTSLETALVASLAALGVGAPAAAAPAAVRP